MPKITYKERKFAAASQQIITQANTILDEYAVQGYDLTLRQLYYQFVARAIIANNMRSYKRLGSIINDARLAGEIDWSRIVDRTRSVHQLPSWDSPRNIVAACASQFRYDKWEDQPQRVEVWIEKEALAGIFERVCDELQLPLLSCRGYTSQSEMWSSAMRLKAYREAKQEPVILHFGDHDPSGLDMTNDIDRRLTTFMGGLPVERLALNMDQVQQFGPPPNPAKTTDSRAEDYIAQHGDESWELDAMEPAYLAQLVRDFVLSVRDKRLWKAAEKRELEARAHLKAVAQDWDEIVAKLEVSDEEE